MLQFEPVQNSIEYHMEYTMIQFEPCYHVRVKACFDWFGMFKILRWLKT